VQNNKMSGAVNN